jgi:outer membrane protein assembly factor BamB
VNDTTPTPPPPSAEPWCDSAAATLWRTAARRCAVVAAICSVVIAAALTVAFSRQLSLTIHEPVVIQQMRRQLMDEPYNATLQVELRKLDRQLRQTHFERTRFLDIGAVLLVVAVGWTLASTFLAVRIGRWYPPAPNEAGAADAAWRSRDVGMIGVATAAVVLAVGAWVFTRPDLEPEIEPPPPLELAWPRFRGPGGLGQAPTQHPLLPGVDGAVILWKTRLPLPGKNSPVGWGNVIFLAGATETDRAVMAVEASTGKLLWQTDIAPAPGAPSEAPQVLGDTGYAAATGCTDGERYFAIYANGDIAAVDITGRVVWTRALGLPSNQYGLAASLLMAGGQVVVPFDQTYSEDDPPQPRSRLLGLDPATGETRWQVQRDVPDSWTTPVVAETPTGRQLITAANPWVIAYHPADGEEIWRAKLLAGDVAPSPVYADGKVYVTMEGAGLFAVRSDGVGDVTDTHVAWSSTDHSYPDIISPLATERHVLLLSSYGLLQLFDATTGERMWMHDYGQSFYASPLLLANEQVLLVSARGEMFVLKLGEAYEQLATAELGEGVSATPLPGGEHIVIRGERHLFCIGRPQEDTNGAK